MRAITLKAFWRSTLELICIISAVLFSAVSLSAQDTISFFDFDNNVNQGWTTGASGINGGSDNRCSWEIGVPNGGQGYNNFWFQWRFEGNFDPTTDHSSNNTINKVAGQGLGASSTTQGISGHFVNSSEWIQSPAINCSDKYNVSLNFWRWANFEPDMDFAYVEISNDGISWFTLDHPASVEDVNWTEITLDISQYADWQSTVYVRWRSESDGWTYYSGWNIDDILITGKTTTNDNDSRITAGSITAPAIISSLTDTYEERIDIGEFIISDAGSGDGLATILDTLVFTAGSGNTVENWKKTLGAVYLYNPNFTSQPNSELQGIVKKNTIYFANSELLTIPDGSSDTYVLRFYLKKDLSNLEEKQNYDINLIHSEQKINSNSSFIGSGSLTTGSTNLEIEITATELRFITEPDALQAKDRVVQPIISVGATDENGNIDIDFNAVIIIRNTAGIGNSNRNEDAINGVATFSNFMFTRTGGPTTLYTIHRGPSSVVNTSSSVQVTILDNVDNGFFFDNFDDSGITGWTNGASGINGGVDNRTSWEHGNPSGGNGFVDFGWFQFEVGNPDPTADASSNTINNVYGQGLNTTTYTEGVSSYFTNSNEWLMSPAINCSDYYNIQFSFERWANFESNADTAYVEVSSDGINWTTLNHPQFPQDESWTNVTLNISDIADRKETVYLRWRSASDGSAQHSGWNIDDVQLTGIYSPETDWTGNSSSDWHDVNNWSGGVLPNELSNVTILESAPNYPVISSTGAKCNFLSISTNTSLVIENTGELEVFGDIVLETSSSSYGTLVEKGSLLLYGKGQMSRDIEQRKWHYVSSPFSNTSSNLFGPEIYRYNEMLASDNWVYGWELATDEIMQVATGYDVYMSKGASILMEGQFNSGDFVVNVTNTDGAEVAEHEGWNLVGNPYPSVIDWDAVTGWTKTNINNAIYIWDKELQNFVTYISGVGVNGGSNYIPPMQGFFIKVSNPGNGTLSMSNEVRVSNSDSKLKFGGSEEALNIKLSSADFYDETIVRYTDEATDDYNIGFDAEKKFSTNPDVPQIYSQINELPIAINSFGYQNDYIKVPLYISVTIKGVHTISIDGVIEIDPNKSIFLEDMETGDMINMRENNEHSFTTGRVSNFNRFILHVGLQTDNNGDLTPVSITPETGSQLKIYSVENTLVIENEDNSHPVELVEIYDLSGGLRYRSNTKQFGTINVNLEDQSGIFVVRVNKQLNYSSQKIILK